MPQTYSGRSGNLRFYAQGTVTGTPYFEVKFVNMDFVGPVARQRPPDSIFTFVGGYSHSPTDASYEQQFYEPQTLSFSANIDDTTNRVKLRQALSNLDDESPWQVGTNLWQSTKGKGSIIGPDGNFLATQPFFDTKKVATDVEVLWDPLGASSAFGMRYEEFYPSPSIIEFRESADAVTLSVNGGLVYGNIRSLTEFTDGIES
jgi:hypothetical protein